MKKERKKRKKKWHSLLISKGELKTSAFWITEWDSIHVCEKARSLTSFLWRLWIKQTRGGWISLWSAEACLSRQKNRVRACPPSQLIKLVKYFFHCLFIAFHSLFRLMRRAFCVFIILGTMLYCKILVDVSDQNFYWVPNNYQVPSRCKAMGKTHVVLAVMEPTF